MMNYERLNSVTEIQQISDYSRLLSFLLSMVTAGFAIVIWWIIRALASDIKDIRIDQISHKSVCVDRYRTKKEAELQWMELSSKLTNMENLAKERHEQVWKKIDNQTSLFMQEKQNLNAVITGSQDRVSKLETKVELLENK